MTETPGRFSSCIALVALALAAALPGQVAAAQGCPGDLFVDGEVNGADLGVLLSQWGPVGVGTVSDIDGNGIVEGGDLGLLLSGWGSCPPSIASVVPPAGCPGGGTEITISGSAFLSTSAVTVGGVACPAFTIESTSAIRATLPPGRSGIAQVAVWTNAGSAEAAQGFTYLAPSLSSVSPASGASAGGTLIALAGACLDGADQVSVRGEPCADVVVVSPSEVVAVTPPGTIGTADITVAGPWGIVTLAGAFTYSGGHSAPTVSTVSPASGSIAGNTLITVTGTNFVTGATTVTVGGIAATSVSVTSATTLTARTPAGTAGPKTVSVTTAGGTGSMASAFTYVAVPPSVTTVSPATGPTAGNTLITVTGTSFVTGATTVTVGGVAATSVSVTSATTLTARTPAHTAGSKSVSVTTEGGTASKANAFTYVAGDRGRR